jgi:transcription factor 1
MHLIMGEWLWQVYKISCSMQTSDLCWSYQRTSAGPLDPARCKVSVIAEAVAESKYALPGDDLQPYENHFHPPGSGATSTKRTDNRKKGAAMSALTITPRADCVSNGV